MKHKKRAALAVESRDAITNSVANLPDSGSTLFILPNAYQLSVVEAAGIGAVRRCVSLIANAIAGQRWTEWFVDRRIEPVSRIVKRPSAMMTRREWVWRVISSMALDDIAYLYMTGGVDDEGIPGSLIPLPRQLVSPSGNIDPYGIFEPTQYLISGKTQPVSSEYIIPMRSAFWPGVPPHLIGILRMARNTLMSAHSADAYAARFWSAGGHPTTVLTTEQELHGTQADDFAQRWRDRRTRGPDYPAVMGKGVKAEPFGADINNSVAVDARRNIMLEVANLFGVPSRYLNITPGGTSMTYSNIQDEALSLERFTLSGFVDPIQDVISDLLPEERFMLIDMSRLTRAGQEARFRAWAIATGQKGWMMPSEVRTEEAMEPSPDIDTMEAAAVTGAEAFTNSANEPQAQPQEAPA